jgi:hypothetical protein
VLKLADGSQVEMNQRTELAVRAAWSGQTVRLERGDIIIEAAKQRRGGLRVQTRDSVATVKGTVFAVSSGAAGSLVSVVEGQVAVTQPGAEKILKPGEKAATSPALERVDVRQTVAWSQNAEKYYALLAEFIHIEKQLAEMPAPAWRTEAKLLRYLPAGAQVYFAIPNLSGTIRDALRLLDRRSSENAVLREWWESEQARELRKTLDSIQAVTPLLGDEVLFVLASPATGSGDQLPLMLAQVQPDRHAALKTAMDKMAIDHHGDLPFQITPELLLVSDTKANLATMTARLGGGANTAFASEIARRYQRGVSWLVGLDIASFDAALQAEEGRVMGMGNMRYLFFEQRSGGGRDENEVTLSFQGTRTGISSWLATPGAAGSGEYVSPDAVLAFSASTRNPRQAFDEMLALVGQQGSLGKEISEFEAETGINVGNDIASALGTDFTVAIERPSLPLPGWVVAFEALRPSVLDETARRLVDAFNRKVASGQVDPSHAGKTLTLGQETASGRVWNTLKSSATGGITLYWTYDRGYLVASTDRALALRAITIRETGSSLVRSLNFQQRFPTTSSLHHSGFLWFNTNGVLADLAGLVQSPAVKSLLGSRDPLLVVLDGETERIHAASRTRLTSLVLDLMLAGGSAHQAGSRTM